MGRATESATEELTGRERLVRAAARRPVDRTPVWLLGQTGPWLAEHRELRDRAGDGAWRDPETLAALARLPVERFGLDAAELRLDPLAPAAAMGLEADPGAGACARVTRLEDVERLQAFDPERATGWAGLAVARLRELVGADTAVVAACPAPFTLAACMAAGRAAPSGLEARALALGRPAVLRELLERVADALVPWIGMLVDAGADAILLRDACGGALDAARHRELLFAPMERLVCASKALGKAVVLHVDRGSHLVARLPDLGPDVLGLDASADAREAARLVADRCALLGNLDPAVLLVEDPSTVEGEAHRVLASLGGVPGRILGTGGDVPRGARAEAVAAVVRAARGWEPL